MIRQAMITQEAPLTPLELPSGTRLGDFELLTPIGAGGQGQLFLARPAKARGSAKAARAWARARLLMGGIDRELAERWALAGLKLAPAARAAALHDEHTALADPQASHPHLVSLYSRRRPGHTGRDLGVAEVAGAGGREAVHWLALAYEPGASLADLLTRGGAIQLSWTLRIAAQVAAALEHLHGQMGRAHLDVKPGNILVSRDAGGLPHAVLIDLGASELIGRSPGRAIYGSGPYLAPERLSAPDAPVSLLADMFGLGVTLQAMLGPIPAPPALARLIADATEADPARRRALLPDMSYFLERLRDSSES